jgi:hypothetical protein
MVLKIENNLADSWIRYDDSNSPVFDYGHKGEKSQKITNHTEKLSIS